MSACDEVGQCIKRIGLDVHRRALMVYRAGHRVQTTPFDMLDGHRTFARQLFDLRVMRRQINTHRPGRTIGQYLAYHLLPV